ncbi:MAG: hypothetical protein HC904_07850 [Blastochloris sp.]|nr:hypothetical protein [Blastochloris sp.]
MIIHLDTDLYLGSMTTWTRGTCSLEVLEIASGKNIFDRHYDLLAEKDFHERLAQLVVFLREKLETEPCG